MTLEDIIAQCPVPLENLWVSVHVRADYSSDDPASMRYLYCIGRLGTAFADKPIIVAQGIPAGETHALLQEFTDYLAANRKILGLPLNSSLLLTFLYLYL